MSDHVHKWIYIGDYYEGNLECLECGLAMGMHDPDIVTMLNDCAQLKVENRRLKELAQETADKPAYVQGWMRENGIVVNDMGDKWQKAFFSVYTDLVEVAEKCRQFLEEPADD